MVSTGLDFTNGVWVTTAGKEFRCIILAGGGGCCLSDDVTDIKGEVFLDESAFGMVEVEYSVHSLSLRLDLDFEKS